MRAEHKFFIGCVGGALGVGVALSGLSTIPDAHAAVTPARSAPQVVVTLPSSYPYVNWTGEGGHVLDATIRVNDPGQATYFQAFDGRVGGVNQYFGVQSSFDGTCLVVWSQFRVAAANASSGTRLTGSTVAVQGDGVFTSLRRRVACPTTGSMYHFVLAEVGESRWFSMTVNGRSLGSMAFNGTSISSTGGSWLEYFPNNYSSSPSPVPYASASFSVTSR